MCFCLAKTTRKSLCYFKLQGQLGRQRFTYRFNFLKQRDTLQKWDGSTIPNTLKNKCWSAGVACNNSALTILKQTIRKFSFKPIIASSVLMKKRGQLLKNGAFIFKLPLEESLASQPRLMLGKKRVGVKWCLVPTRHLAAVFPSIFFNLAEGQEL